MKSKWKDPYIVTAILLNEAYKIADQGGVGGVFHTPVNGDWLKLYNQRFLEPIVVITDKP